MLEEKIRNLVARYLSREIDRSGFAQEFAAFYFQVRNSSGVSPAARQLCNLIVLPFGELSRGDRSESSFREELMRIARPFAVRQLNPRFESSVPPQKPFLIYFWVKGSGPIRKPPTMGTDSRIDPTRRLVMAS